MRVLLATAALVLTMASSIVMVQLQQAPAPPSRAGGATPAAAPWETVVRGAYENKGIAQVERLGARWVLNVMCNGTHATYIDDTDIDLAAHSKGYVSARYRYVDRTIDVQCVRAPCPPVQERRIALERLTPLTATPDQAREMARDCRTAVGR